MTRTLVTVLLLCGLCWAFAGCALDQAGVGSQAGAGLAASDDSSARLPLSAAPSTMANPDGFDPIVSQSGFQVFCDVLIIDAPAGAISRSRELWGHLREDTLGVKLADHLARNGFRVGVGRAADFPAVSALLAKARDTNLRNGRMRFESDSAMEVILDPQVKARRPFVFAMNGAVSGDEYPAGVTVYWVQAWHDIEHIDTVNLTLVPEIRYGRVKDRYYSPGIPRGEQYRDVGRVFNEVKLEVPLPRGEFMVLAPRATEGPALVLGRAMLADDANQAQPRELVMLVRPRVVRTPG